MLILKSKRFIINIARNNCEVYSDAEGANMIKDYDARSFATKGVRIKSNFHSHNYLCGHAVGTVSDYVKEAVACGLETIGISDHCNCPYGGYYNMPAGMESDYLSQFDAARAKYGDRIRILSAVEIEYFDDQAEFYENLLSKLDYLVLGQHRFYYGGAIRDSFCDGTNEDIVVAYFNSIERGVKSGFFAMVAHPDLIFYQHQPVTPAIADAFDSLVKVAAECGVPIELNANGIRNHRFIYPTDLLISLCQKYDAPVVVSSDCHAPNELCDSYMRDLYAFALDKKLNVVNELRLRGRDR